MTLSADLKARLRYALTGQAAADELSAILDFLAQTPDGTGLVLSKLLVEPAATALIATPGGGQAGALQLVAELNNVGTVATAGDSVKLPAAVAGLTIMVLNSGANAMQVFGLGTDTIDSQLAATGVTQMKNSLVIFACFAAGAWQTEGLSTGFAGSLQTQSFNNAITAFATGGQANGVVLAALVNRISICATAGDSVKLPVSAAGLPVVVINDGVASANVFPQTGDTINTLAANAAFAVPAGAVVVFYCTVAGAWQTSPGQIPLPSKYTLNAGAGPLTAAAGDLTGAGEVFAEYSALGANALTTRTAVQMIADGGYKIGQSYQLQIANTSLAGDGSITAAAGVTITGNATLPRNTVRTFIVTVTALTTVTFQSVSEAPSDIGQMAFTKFTLNAGGGPLVAGAGDLTGALDVCAQYSAVNASTLTTRTAALMIADGGYKIGSSWRCRIVNSAGGTATLTAGVGVTVTGHAAILTNTYVDYVVTVTGAATITFQSVGSGPQP